MAILNKDPIPKDKIIKFKQIKAVVFSVLLFFLFQTLFTISYLYPSQNNENDKINILLITIDTLRADRLSCYGSQNVKTPNIDKLAERGILFSRAFAHTSTTLPSHANILLGSTPLQHGVHDNLNFIIQNESLTLAEHLKSHGYSTAAFVGAYPLDSRFGLNQGFDIYDDNYTRPHFQTISSMERKAEDVLDNALNWVRGQNNPWFLWIHCFDPHIPYEPPDPFKAQYEDPYDGEVAYVDSALGKLFDHLEESHLYEKTLIVFTGDHGESLGQHGEMTHGFFAYNTTIWIPLIMCHPDAKKDHVDQYVSHIDIFPTVCDAAGISKPPSLQGTSLLPALKGKRLQKKLIYFESMYPYYSRGWAPLRGYIDGNEKYIDSPIPEFFDLEKDFDENENLSTDKDLQKLKKQHEAVMKNYTSEVSTRAEKKLDREALERMRSLGYIATYQGSRKKEFGSKDDVKVRLVFHNRTTHAMAMYKDGKVKDAINLLEAIINERNDMSIAYQRLAIIYEKENKIQKTIEILKQGLQFMPSNYESFGILIRALRISGQYDELIRTFQDTRLREIDFDPTIWNLLGIAYAKKGDLEKAIQAYEQALSLDNKYAEILNNLADVLFSQALKRKNLTTLQKSEDSYKKAIEIDPDYPAPYFGLGKLYRQIENIDGAIHCWEKVIELQSEVGQALFYLGLAYLEKGDKAKALLYFTRLKEKFYSSYPEAQKRKLDDLIEKCKK